MMPPLCHAGDSGQVDGGRLTAGSSGGAAPAQRPAASPSSVDRGIRIAAHPAHAHGTEWAPAVAASYPKCVGNMHLGGSDACTAEHAAAWMHAIYEMPEKLAWHCMQGCLLRMTMLGHEDLTLPPQARPAADAQPFAATDGRPRRRLRQRGETA